MKNEQKQCICWAYIVTLYTYEVYVTLDNVRCHTTSFRSNNLRNPTALSQHIWTLMDNTTNINISWKITSAEAFNNQTNRCNYVPLKKLYIIYNSDMATLDKKSELMSTRRHKDKYLL